MSSAFNIMSQAAASPVVNRAWDLRYLSYGGPVKFDGGTSNQDGPVGSSSVFEVSSSPALYVGGEELNPRAMTFSPDGSKLYVIGQAGDDLNQYSLSRRFNVTNSYVTHDGTYIVNNDASEGTPRGLYFKPDGTMFFRIGNARDTVDVWSLKQPWDVTAASNVTYESSKILAISGGTKGGISFSNDGTKMYLIDYAYTERLRYYELSTPWDPSTAGTVVGVNVGANNYEGISFSNDGHFMLIVNRSNITIDQWYLTTAWDPTTKSTTATKSVSAGGSSPTGLFLSPDSKMLSWADSGSDNVNIAVLGGVASSASGSNVSGLGFKPDGTEMYWITDSDNKINQTNLPTAWDLSTRGNVSTVKTYSVGLSENAPHGLYIKPDGTSLFTTGTALDNVQEFTMSTPWDISSIDSQINHSVALGTLPTGISFKPDGTKMYIVDDGLDEINEFEVPERWNPDSVLETHLKFTLSLTDHNSDLTGPGDLTFSPDGKRMFLGCNGATGVVQFNLKVAWDLSTAELVPNTFEYNTSLFANEGTILGNPAAIAFKPDGLKLFASGNKNYFFEFDITETPTVAYNEEIT